VPPLIFAKERFDMRGGFIFDIMMLKGKKVNIRAFGGFPLAFWDFWGYYGF
jgi:hypothetical protein